MSDLVCTVYETRIEAETEDTKAGKQSRWADFIVLCLQSADEIMICPQGNFY